jgi:signal transduction histidine kinase
MRKSFLNIFTFLFLAVTFTTAYTAQAQVRAYRVTDRQVQTLINRIETRTDNFRSGLDRALDRIIYDAISTLAVPQRLMCRKF